MCGLVLFWGNWCCRMLKSCWLVSVNLMMLLLKGWMVSRLFIVVGLFGLIVRFVWMLFGFMKVMFVVFCLCVKVSWLLVMRLFSEELLFGVLVWWVVLCGSVVIGLLC